MPAGRAIYRVCWCAALLLAAACDGGDENPESRIHALIAAGAEAAEARSVDGLGALLHPDFRDHQGNNPATLRRLLTGWFLRHRNIHLLTRIEKIEQLSPTRAEVALVAAMAGSAIGDASALAGLRARVYRFELTLIRDQDWRVLRAAYSPAHIADLH